MCQLCSDGWEYATAYHDAQDALAQGCPFVLVPLEQYLASTTLISLIEQRVDVAAAFLHPDRAARSRLHIALALLAYEAHADANLAPGESS